MSGDLQGKDLKLNFIKLDDIEFTEIEQNVENYNSKEDLIEFINGLNLDDNKLYKINLVGKRNFEINTREILNLVNQQNILKIKDFTKLKYNLDELKNENTLKGIFVAEALKKLETGEYTKDEIEKAIEIGISNMQ